MKRLFYLLFGLVLLPALLYAQGSLSPKDINDNLTNNYYNKTASDARYATTTYGYSSAEVDILLAPKADKTYVNATDEAIISDNDSQDVQIEANRVAITLKASQTDMDSAEVAINLNNIDDDSQDVTIEANKVGVASLEVGLQTHQNNPTGAHAATAISATWTNVQVSLDSIETAIQSIVVGSGFALESWVNSTLETNFYNKTQTNATIEAAIAAIPTPSVNQTISVVAGEDLSAGDVVSLINSGGTMKAYNNPLTVSTSPNGAESVFNSAATTYCSAVALDSTRFLVAYKDSDTYPKAIVGTVSGSSISWGSESNAFENINSAYITTCKIGTDKVLVAYTYADTSGAVGRCVVLSVSTSTITVNTPANTYASARTNYASLSTLDSDKAILAFQASADGKGYSQIITVSATTPSASAEVKFNDASTPYISCSALSSTSAIVAYQDGGNSNYGTAQVLSISGTTITPGTEYVFNSGTTQYISCGIDALNTGIIVYQDVGNSNYGTAISFSVDGSVISFGSEVVFSAKNASLYEAIVKVNNGKFLVAFRNGQDSLGQNVILTLTSGVITSSSSYQFNNENTGANIGICYLDSNKTVISFSDSGNSSYGTAVVNTWATSSYASVSGISSGAYSSGSDAVVLISGSYDGLSSLIPGSPYFVNASFELQTTPVSLTSTIYSSAATTREIHFGTAKSSTEIVLNIDYR